ncbi:uncharacterized protein G6M90_00g046360 [Metarhizium brunneum]|uniref:Uncharacterized protein n=1 Tax=Metarhizium brunneum TaxID=500148 RepID=A0A7D5Z5I1_9HYPO|nr:hypothetical protein G6M90_00g046360 [Metarhizium brunneum]
MKFVASLLALALAALAAPTPTPDTAVSWNQNFSCGADFRTKFCHAVNFHSRCVNGRFYSDAGDSCANCWCTYRDERVNAATPMWIANWG